MKIRDEHGLLLDLTEVAVIGRYIAAPKGSPEYKGMRGAPRPMVDTVTVTMKSGVHVQLKMEKPQYEAMVSEWLEL